MLKLLNNIRLVPFEPEFHSAKLYEWYYSGDYPEFYREYPQCPSAVELASAAQGKTFMVIRSQDSAIVGVATFHNVREASRTFETGVLIEKKFQKSGYGVTATKILLNWLFNDCNYYKSSMQVLAENSELCNILDKFGAYREGGKDAILKKHVYMEGEYHNVAVYAMFKRDFNRLYREEFQTKVPRLEVPPTFKFHETRLESFEKESHGRFPIWEQGQAGQTLSRAAVSTPTTAA